MVNIATSMMIASGTLTIGTSAPAFSARPPKS